MVDLHLGSVVGNHRRGQIHLSQVGQSATLKNVSTKASDNKTFRDVIAEHVHGKWLRNMYCDIPFLRFFGLVV